MSARRAAIQLTARARRDLENILIYSEQTWGLQQTLVYQDAIERAVRWLRDHPRLGRPRDDLFPGC